MALTRAKTVDTAKTEAAVANKVAEETVVNTEVKDDAPDANLEVSAAKVADVEQGKVDQPEHAVEGEVEPEPEVDEPQIQAELKPEPKEVATRTEQAPTVAEQRKSAMANFGNELAEQGFEGLELTGFSFDRIKLHEGVFKLGSEEVDLGTEFHAVIQATRAAYIVRQHTGEDAEIYYAIDPEGQFLTDGSPATDILEKWAEDGYGIEGSPVDIKKYIEAMATLVNRDDEHNDSVVTLSIPPASRDRLTGAAAQAKIKYKTTLDGVILKVKVGAKVGEGKKAFRPWVFSVASKV